MLYEKNLLALGFLLSLSNITEASLTPYTSGGQSLIYSSISNVTWLQDANLLGTLEAKALIQDGNYNSLINNIINASDSVINDTPNYYDDGTYTLTSNDFGSNGSVTWWGAMAFVHYLNTINYANSNQWALPTTKQPDPIDLDGVYNYNYGYSYSYIPTSKMTELFYKELGGTTGTLIPSGPFSNIQVPDAQNQYVQNSKYWYSTEIPFLTHMAVFLDTTHAISDWMDVNKGNQFYAWAYSPGVISALPVPGALWLFGTGLLGLFSLKARITNQR